MTDQLRYFRHVRTGAIRTTTGGAFLGFPYEETNADATGEPRTVKAAAAKRRGRPKKAATDNA